MTEKLMKNIYRIEVELPQNPMRYVNSYVIKGADENLIIDTGFRTEVCKDALMEGLKELEIDLSKTDILLTHLHSDHSGLAPDIIKPGRKVYISRDEITWLCGDDRVDKWVRDMQLMSTTGFPIETLFEQFIDNPSHSQASDIEFDDYTPVDDGDVLDYGGYKLKAVLTAGHTPAHMCFYMEEQKAMFTGDHVLYDISPNITMWEGMDDPLGSYLESLKMIDKYEVETTFPGHRKPGDFHGRIAALLEHHRERLNECESIVAQNPYCNVCDVASKMKWSIRCKSWEDFPLNQKWFAVGECHSHMRALEKQGRVKADRSGDVTHYSVK